MTKEIKMKGPKRILFIGDAVVPTGFSTVTHNIIKNLPRSYEVHHLGINYRGDPHPYDWKIYPAGIAGDQMGFNRIGHFQSLSPNGIFILNDPWVIPIYLRKIKETFGDKVPPVIVYMPIDSMNMDQEWFSEYDIVTKTVVYTKFGYDEVKRVYDDSTYIVPHGLDQANFKTSGPRHTVKQKLFENRSVPPDSFIVLSANRNQPRKRTDLTVRAFANFAKDKPKNVRLYLHMGIKDAGWDILKLATRYGVDERLIITNLNRGIQTGPVEELNIIYNACDVGINTSWGEGWSLTNMEHAATGAPQVVPDHSAFSELYRGVGLLTPIKEYLDNNDTLTTGAIVDTDAMAENLNSLYEDKKLYDKLSQNSKEKFSGKEYSWDYIVREYWIPLFGEAYG